MSSDIQSHSAHDRARRIRRVLWIILFLNLAVAAAKYAYGLITHSASMQADGIHSLFDGSSNVIGLIGMTIAARPADPTHPYGHQKFETYASAFIGLMLLFAAYNVGTTAVQDLVTGQYGARVDAGSFIVMLATLAVNIGVTIWERREGKRLGSAILAADAQHTLSDVMVSLSVIVGLVFVKLGFGIADPIAALVVTVAILYTAIAVFKQANSTLSDAARLSMVEVRGVVFSVPGVLGTHHIRTRGSDAEIYVDLHVLVDGAETVFHGHEIAEEVEAALKRAFPQVVDVVVHIEPFSEEELAISLAELENDHCHLEEAPHNDGESTAPVPYIEPTSES